MLFNTIEFVVLALVAFGGYYLPFMRRYQVLWLVAASLVFYGWSAPWLLVLLLGSMLLNSSLGFYVGVQPDRRKQRLAVTIGVAANLALLATFKYAGLLASLFIDAATQPGHFLLHIPLPIGISFYTFQGISLLVDVYRDRALPAERQELPTQKPFRKALLHDIFYVGFFPQLVAGPIVKAQDFLPQIRPKYWRDIDWEAAFRALVVGYFLKGVVADNLAEFTHELSLPSLYAMTNAYRISLLLGYSVQIFADFSGYSLIAIGICHLFGYRLMKNFDFPYISRSITEFWRRWHISLSSWLREYLYIPLGGNRKGVVRTYVNLMLVMLLGGLWHGAAWSYMIWGGYHGLWLVLERLTGQYVRLPRRWWLDTLRMIWVFALATLGWLLFKLNDFDHVQTFFRLLAASPLNFADFWQFKIYHILFYTLPVFVYHLLYLASRTATWAPRIRWATPLLLSMLLFMIVFNMGLKAEFIYFQF